MNKWIEVNGRKVLPNQFIYYLDLYRSKSKVVTYQKKYQYCDMIYVIQALADDYNQGKKELDHEYDYDFIKRNGYQIPVNHSLPEAIEELFNQLQELLQINLSQLLDECVILSQKRYQEYLKKQRKEQERVQKIKNLKLNSYSKLDQITYLINLQYAKVKNQNYHVSEQETLAVNYLSDLLITQISSEYISYAQMTRGVQNEFLSEDDITTLLEDKYHVEKDYEWYSEDFLGNMLDDETIIKIDDVLDICLERLLKIIGIEHL